MEQEDRKRREMSKRDNEQERSEAKQRANACYYSKEDRMHNEKFLHLNSNLSFYWNAAITVNLNLSSILSDNEVYRLTTKWDQWIRVLFLDECKNQSKMDAASLCRTWQYQYMLDVQFVSIRATSKRVKRNLSSSFFSFPSMDGWTMIKSETASD